MRVAMLITAVCMAGCHVSESAPPKGAAARALQVSSPSGTVPSGTGTESAPVDLSGPDYVCDYTATVAANRDLLVRATFDGVEVPAGGSAHVLVLDAAAVAAQCETGPWLDDDGGQGFTWGLGPPGIVRGDFLLDGSAVLLRFLDVEAGALIFPSSASEASDVAFDFIPWEAP